MSLLHTRLDVGILEPCECLKTQVPFCHPRVVLILKSQYGVFQGVSNQRREDVETGTRSMWKLSLKKNTLNLHQDSSAWILWLERSVMASSLRETAKSTFYVENPGLWPEFLEPWKKWRVASRGLPAWSNTAPSREVNSFHKHMHPEEPRSFLSLPERSS